MKKEFVQKIASIQTSLKAPKGQRNSFGNYDYRSCEDILEALKPLLKDLVLTVTDDVVLIGDRFYIKATATLTDGEDSISNTAFAREELTKKGMDSSQVTGSTSSYARKYALNGLLCIDDNKDADTMDNRPTPKQETPKTVAPKQEVVDIDTRLKNQINFLNGLKDNSVGKDKAETTFKAARELCKELKAKNRDNDFNIIVNLVHQKTLKEGE